MVKVKNIRELEKAIERIVSKYLEKQYLTIQLPNQPPIPEDPTRAKLKAVINAFAYPATCIQPAESLLRKRGKIAQEIVNIQIDFGKFKGQRILELPSWYLFWIMRNMNYFHKEVLEGSLRIVRGLL